MLLASKISSSLQFMGGHNTRVNSLIFKDFLNELSIKYLLERVTRSVAMTSFPRCSERTLNYW